MNTDGERLRRWRLILGGESAAGTGVRLEGRDAALDRVLGALYDESERQGGLGGSAPSVARWLGDIREYFPTNVVQILQQDALTRLGLRQMLLQPELLGAVEPDVNLVATLLSLNWVLPNKTRDTARRVVRRVVEDLERRLASPLRQAVTGALDRAARNRRPRPQDIDWRRTLQVNLKHYQPEYQTVIPVTRIGFGRRGAALRDVILALDQSGSMAASVVYAGVFGAVLASLRTLRTAVVAFDTAVVDLTAALSDPVDVLFGTQLGGGTDIARALTYCQGLVQRPQDTILILISDLFEGGDVGAMHRRLAGLVMAGVQVIVLLALDDQGKPAYDHRHAAAFAALGVPCFACMPALFPELMAAAIRRQDLGQWAASHGIVLDEPVTER
jgi:hypothetical protein